jgi:hypothetical protein
MTAEQFFLALEPGFQLCGKGGIPKRGICAVSFLLGDYAFFSLVISLHFRAFSWLLTFGEKVWAPTSGI